MNLNRDEIIKEQTFVKTFKDLFMFGLIALALILADMPKLTIIPLIVSVMAISIYKIASKERGDL